MIFFFFFMISATRSVNFQMVLLLLSIHELRELFTKM